jgi:hypothetical protein
LKLQGALKEIKKMEPSTKNLWDVIFNVVALIAAMVGFGVGLYQWRRSQAWQRAEKLDKLVDKFETDELLKLATVILDWSDRKGHLAGRELTVRNDEVLLALREHQDIDETPKFPGEQPAMRDAYDAILAFFNRLELAISTKLIDAKPAKSYFAYWLERFLAFDSHRDTNNVLKGKTPQLMVIRYIKAYADIDSINKLCGHFKMAQPPAEKEVGNASG